MSELLKQTVLERIFRYKKTIVAFFMAVALDPNVVEVVLPFLPEAWGSVARPVLIAVAVWFARNTPTPEEDGDPDIAPADEDDFADLPPEAFIEDKAGPYTAEPAENQEGTQDDEAEAA